MWLTKTTSTLAHLATATFALAEPPPAGTAKGTCAKNAEPAVALANAAAFIDQKDERKPTVLILSDVKLPTEKWTSENTPTSSQSPSRGEASAYVVGGVGATGLSAGSSAGSPGLLAKLMP